MQPVRALGSAGVGRITVLLTVLPVALAGLGDQSPSLVQGMLEALGPLPSLPRDGREFAALLSGEACSSRCCRAAGG